MFGRGVEHLLMCFPIREKTVLIVIPNELIIESWYNW